MIHFAISYPRQLSELGMILQDIDEDCRRGVLKDAIAEMDDTAELREMRDALDGVDEYDRKSMLLELTLRTSSAPASTAGLISAGFKESMETRNSSSRRRRTSSPTAVNG